jgi:glycerol kinase
MPREALTDRKEKILAANLKMNLTHKDFVLDADTTKVKAILVDRQAKILARSSVPVASQFPKSGRVEQ